MSALFIGRGDCHLGRTRRDAEGNVVEQTGAKWEPNPEGGCVAICAMDPDKMEAVGATEVFGDWDAAHYLETVLKKLGPGRPVNIPDFRAILSGYVDDTGEKDIFLRILQQTWIRLSGLHRDRVDGGPRERGGKQCRAVKYVTALF